MTEQNQKGLKYSENSAQATLWQFKKVIETGEVRYLLILEDYDELPEFDFEVLNLVWQHIYQEFSDISGGNKADLWLLKVKRLTDMKQSFKRHSHMLSLVEQIDNLNLHVLLPDLLDEVKKDGYEIELDDFKKTFEKAYTRLMRMKNQIGAFQREQENEDVGDQSLDNLIVRLEKFQGYQFNKHEMNVREFANIYKNYKDAEAN